MQSAGVGWPPFLSFSFLFRAFSHRLARVFCSKILHARQLIEFEGINRAPSTTVTFNPTKGIFSPSLSFSIETVFIYSFFFFLTESFIGEFKVRPRSNIIFARIFTNSCADGTPCENPATRRVNKNISTRIKM